jgi:hypothetical protein
MKLREAMSLYRSPLIIEGVSMPITSRVGSQYAIEQYRDATQRLARLAGVTLPSFRCQKCRKSRVVNGRRQAVRGTSRYGYHCADCAVPGKT